VGSSLADLGLYWGL